MNSQGQLRLTGGRKLLSPPGRLTRPTTGRVREAVMNILKQRLQGCRWLDLCCGSGIMGCEAIQRGAAEVIAIEKDRRTALIAQKNLLATSMSCKPVAKIAVVSRSVQSWLGTKKPVEPFDLIYFDPPYEAGIYTPVLEQISRQGLLHPEGLMICEYDKSTELQPDSRSWNIHDRRGYGKTGLLFLALSHRERYPGDTGSKQPQTNPEV